MTHHGTYRALTLLYPKAFRDRYRDDLTQAHDALIADLGPTRAWGRAGLDLLVTVPRYRLETLMDNRNSNTALNVIVGALVVLGAVVPTIGIGFALIPIALAVIIVVSQRTNLAESLRAPDTNRRRRRLITSATLAALSVLVVAVFIADIGRDDEWGDRWVVYNLVFTVTAAASVIYLVVGLLTKKSRPAGSVQATSA